MKIKTDPIRKNKTFASLQSTKQKHADHSPSQFRQLAKDKESRVLKQDQSNIKDRSLSDSQSSDSSCFEKKFYRCGCLSHRQGCGAPKYHDYLGIMRQERERKKQQRSFSELIKGNIEKGIPFLDSEGEGEEDSKFSAIKTPEKEVNKLDNIVQINESAEYSTKKVHEQITITIGNKKYSKIFGNKEEAIKCLELIKQLISQSQIQQ